MSVREKGFEDRREAAAMGIKTLTKLLRTIGFVFSTHFNHMYGVDEAAAYLIEMACNSLAAETAAKTLFRPGKVPTAKWFMNKMHAIPEEDAWKLCDKMLKHTVVEAKRTGMLKGRQIYVAIDKHLHGRHDKDDKNGACVGSKRKAGTNLFETYATIQVVSNKTNVMIDAYRFVKGDTNADFIEQFQSRLDEYDIDAYRVLLDREFFAVDIMQMLDDNGQKFIMPAKKTPEIIRAIEAYHEDLQNDPDSLDKAVIDYTLKSADGKTFTVTVLIKKRPVDGNKKKRNGKKGKEETIADQYIVFATNLSGEEVLREIELIPKEYRKRWGIETGYRQIESIKPWTNSDDEVYRVILFFVAMFMHNMWALARAKKGVNPRDMPLLALLEVMSEMVRDRIRGIPIDPGGAQPT